MFLFCRDCCSSSSCCWSCWRTSTLPPPTWTSFAPLPRAHRLLLSPCWHVVPEGRLRIEVQAPLAHCWYWAPTQLKVPSEAQVPVFWAVVVEFPPEEPAPEPVGVAEAGDEEEEDEEEEDEEEEPVVVASWLVVEEEGAWVLDDAGVVALPAPPPLPPVAKPAEELEVELEPEVPGVGVAVVGAGVLLDVAPLEERLLCTTGLTYTDRSEVVVLLLLLDASPPAVLLLAPAGPVVTIVVSVEEGVVTVLVAKTPPLATALLLVMVVTGSAAPVAKTLEPEPEPAEASSPPPAVAVGREAAPWVWLTGTQPSAETLAKEGVAPVRSLRTLGPGSGKTTSVPGDVLHELTESRLATNSSG